MSRLTFEINRYQCSVELTIEQFKKLEEIDYLDVVMPRLEQLVPARIVPVCAGKSSGCGYPSAGSIAGHVRDSSTYEAVFREPGWTATDTGRHRHEKTCTGYPQAGCAACLEQLRPDVPGFVKIQGASSP